MAQNTVVTLQRDKCIGCGYCEQIAPEYFRMDPSDGKSTLSEAEERKGFFTLRTTQPLAFEICNQAAENCPVKIIRVSKSKK